MTDPLFEEDLLTDYTVNEEAKAAFEKAIRKCKSLKRKHKIKDYDYTLPNQPYASHDLRIFLSNTCIGLDSMTVEIPREILDVMNIIAPYTPESLDILGLIDTEGKDKLEICLVAEIYTDLDT